MIIVNYRLNFNDHTSSLMNILRCTLLLIKQKQLNQYSLHVLLKQLSCDNPAFSCILFFSYYVSVCLEHVCVCLSVPISIITVQWAGTQNKRH